MTPPPLLETTSKKTATSFVYLLQSQKDGKFYLGWTTDLRRRLDEHNARRVQSTKSRAPFKFIGMEIFPNQTQAKARERTLKHNPNMYKQFKKRALCTSLTDVRKEVVG